MCGIVGYVGQKDAKEFLLEGLRRLEYRGYDSAGLALMDSGSIKVSRAVGRIAALEKKIATETLLAKTGIAHTRWATHGKPSERNAHPHTDCTGRIALVHNGIIENYLALKKELIQKKHRFISETDSEVVAHLIEEYLKEEKNFERAWLRTLKLIKGTYGLVAVYAGEPEKIFVARMGSPLIIGIGKGENFVASDVSAMIALTRSVIYLEDGEWAEITADHYSFHRGIKKAYREPVVVEWTEQEAKRTGFPHFMLKEIFEQPESIKNAFRGRIEIEKGMARLGGLREIKEKLRRIKRLLIVSCGSSYYAGLVGEYLLEEYVGIPVEVEFASEFRYRKPIINSETAVLLISQSGETADTLAALREAKEKGALTLGIVNVVGSTIARETDAGIYNHAGPEVSVASTKALTSQLAILVLFTVYLGRQREMSLVMGKRILEELQRIPKQIEEVLGLAPVMKRLAQKYKRTGTILYLGRKYEYPIALEGALKIKEIAYVSAQGYPTGEMKHGPIALIDEKALVVLLIPDDSVFEKNYSGLQEILARGARVLIITTGRKRHFSQSSWIDVVRLPKTLEILTPLLAVVPLQLFAYYMSVAKGYDVDKPRNLAKSVTVE